MKKVIFSTILFSLLSIGLFAQQSNNNKQKTDAAIEQMALDLKLNASQKTLFEDVIEGSMERRQEVKRENVSKEVKQQKLDAINQSENSKMNELLTQDQYKQFLQLKKDQEEAMTKKKKK